MTSARYRRSFLTLKYHNLNADKKQEQVLKWFLHYSVETLNGFNQHNIIIIPIIIITE